MVQAVNTQAIWTFISSVWRRPDLLVPHVTVSSVSEVDYAAMKQHARIEAIIFDKDNTLTAPYVNNVIHPAAQAGLQHAIQTFGPDRVAILSNSAGTLDDDPPTYPAARIIETQLGIAVIRHDDKKPSGLQAVLDHWGIQDAAQICMVGDRLLTDIVFGNMHGMLTIHTMALCHGRDNHQDQWIARVVRRLENQWLYGSMKRIPCNNSNNNNTDTPQQGDAAISAVTDPFGFRSRQRQRIPHKYWPGPETCPLRIKPSAPKH